MLITTVPPECHLSFIAASESPDETQIDDEPVETGEAPSGVVVDVHSMTTQRSTVPLAVAITPGKPQRVDLDHSPNLGPLPQVDGPLASEAGSGLGGALAQHQRLSSVKAPSINAQIPVAASSPAVSIGGMTNASFQTVALTPSSSAGGLDSSAIKHDAETSGMYARLLSIVCVIRLKNPSLQLLVSPIEFC